MQWVHRSGGDVSEHPEHPELLSLSSCTASLFPLPLWSCPIAHSQTNLRLGLGVIKQCREEPHFITSPLCIKCLKATVPSSLRGFPKCCCPLLELGSAERLQAAQKLWDGKEAGQGSSAAGWERIARGDPLWVPACWGWCYVGTRETDSGGRCCVRSSCHPLSPSRRVCTHRLVTPSQSHRGRLGWKPFLTAESPLAADTLPSLSFTQLPGWWNKCSRSAFER